MEINGKTEFFCLIGSPVGHSGSPSMYNYAFQKTDINSVYLAFDVPLGGTRDAVNALKTLGCKGFNVTMPCKTAVAELADELSEAAALIGACNTVEDEESLRRSIGESHILVNATKAGMKPLEDETPVKDPSVFRPDLVVADAVYNPRETRLLREARAGGCKTVVGGIGMLLWQGDAAFRIFTGKCMPTEEIYERFFR